MYSPASDLDEEMPFAFDMTVGELGKYFVTAMALIMMFSFIVIFIVYALFLEKPLFAYWASPVFLALILPILFAKSVGKRVRQAKENKPLYFIEQNFAVIKSGLLGLKPPFLNLNCYLRLTRSGK